MKYLTLFCCLSYLSCSFSPSTGIGFLYNSAAYFNLETTKQYQIASTDTTDGNNDRWNLRSYDTAVIMDQSGPGLISRMWFTFDSRDPDYLRNILIRIYWDDNPVPSVSSPIGDFFGCPYEYRHWTSEYLGMSSGGYYCYFPMPFQKRARIEIINDSPYELYALYFQINYFTLSKWHSETMYFHAQWNRELRTTENRNYTALEVNGSGCFVGIHYNAQSYRGSLVFLEGDEMIYVDRESHPSIYGTGMEDYLNSGWYFKNGTYSALHHGLIMKDEEKARISAYRYHIKDLIPFQKSIQVTYEHGHANEEETDMSTVAFWYQDQSSNPDMNRLQGKNRKVLRRPVAQGVIEGEDLQVADQTRSEIVQMTEFGSDWSNHQQLLLTLDAGETTEISTPELEEKEYDVILYLSQAPESGKFEIEQELFDGYSIHVIPAPILKFSRLQVDQNRRISLIIKNVSSHQAALGIDAIRLIPYRSYIPNWSLIGPFDNPRESDDLRFGLDHEYPPENGYHPDSSYIGKEGKVLNWKNISGVPAGYAMQLWNYIQPYEFVISYAHTYVFAPEEMTVDLMLGSDDGIKVFVNEKEIHRFLAVRIAEPDQTRISVQLNAGWNQLLLKLENNFGGYAFYARFMDPENKLQYNLKPIIN